MLTTIQSKIVEANNIFLFKIYISNKNAEEYVIILPFHLFPQFNVVQLLLVYRKNSTHFALGCRLKMSFDFFPPEGNYSKPDIPLADQRIISPVYMFTR